MLVSQSVSDQVCLVSTCRQPFLANKNFRICHHAMDFATPSSSLLLFLLMLLLRSTSCYCFIQSRPFLSPFTSCSSFSLSPSPFFQSATTVSRRQQHNNNNNNDYMMATPTTTTTSMAKPSSVVSYVEFYSGIGGWTAALEEAAEAVTIGPCQRLAALDHSDLCHAVLQHNYPSIRTHNDDTPGETQTTTPKRKRTMSHNGTNGKDDNDNNDTTVGKTGTKRKLVVQKKPPPMAIEKLSLRQVQEWDATIWVMSPPCQPHTRQHSNQDQDLDDPRSRSFLHLCDLLQDMDKATLPRLIFLENVVGFEKVRLS